MADRIPGTAGQALQVHLVDSSAPLELKPVMGTGHGAAAQHSQQHAHPQHAGHHDPHQALPSDAARTGMHDGTMYAEGATGVPFDSNTPNANHPSVGQRIKEALPGTKEHKAKKEAEGNVAVYS